MALPRVADCVFCGIVAGSVPAFVVTSEPDGVAFLDARPVFPGHVLVAPLSHVSTLQHGLDADGTFVAINNVISQSVPHLHTHVVPRRRKDGLRGFFWPRGKYASDEEAAGYASRIAGTLAPPVSAS